MGKNRNSGNEAARYMKQTKNNNTHTHKKKNTSILIGKTHGGKKFTSKDGQLYRQD